ncbi:MAG: alpha-hydroxy-acid oxidizing protein [Actinomycetota bacterium]|nr:alpha-hydroxy-acid oxidizing protein [Actinomycetota bacterium]
MTESPDPTELKTIDQVISRAREAADPGKHVWAAAGAGQGVTQLRNTAALNRLALVPRVMRDVAALDISSSLAGIPLALPVILAPVGALALYDPNDAMASAIAATRMSTSAFCGILSTSSWEEVAATAPGRHLFQLYVLGDRSWISEILARVEEAGFGALCVTVDTPVIGRRDRSLEDGFTWSVPPEGPPSLSRHGFDYSYRAKFTWPDLEWLCQQTDLPVIIKGVMTPADALQALACGVAGIYVSNHGGRVVDQSLSTIEVLGAIVEAVAGEADVVVDSGFTRGADVCKALALGARAVGIGRLQCWGLAAGGVDGLTRVLEILGDEIANTMANIGCRSVGEITPEHVRWSIPALPS